MALASAQRAPAAASAAALDGMRPAGRLWLPMWMVPLRKVPVVITTLLHSTFSPAHVDVLPQQIIPFQDYCLSRLPSSRFLGLVYLLHVETAEMATHASQAVGLTRCK